MAVAAGVGNCLDASEDGIEIGQDLLVAEPDDGVAKQLEVLSPVGIVLDPVVVDRAVDFDDQAKFGAAQIQDIRPDGVLPPELQPVQPPAP